MEYSKEYVENWFNGIWSQFQRAINTKKGRKAIKDLVKRAKAKMTKEDLENLNKLQFKDGKLCIKE